MKKHDNIITQGQLTINKDGNESFYLTSSIPQGQHRISQIRNVAFGLLIKTDRYQHWVNSKWFIQV